MRISEAGLEEIMEGEIVVPEPYEKTEVWEDGTVVSYTVYPEDEMWDRRDK